MDFIELVEKYCNLIESIDAISIEKLFIECEYLLPMIYAKGLKLKYDEKLINSKIDEPNIKPPIDVLNNKIGSNDIYSAVFDPIYDEELVIGSITDDLADIYLDLKRPLLLYNQNTNELRANALWQWQFNIKHHAGEHILNVLKPIHWINNDHGLK